MNEALIKDIFSDEVFVNSLLECETAEEVKTALKEKNLDLSIDDILCLRRHRISRRICKYCHE